jgi:alkylation response protein AidB-like acyl-CoA dehydrogenase
MNFAPIQLDNEVRQFWAEVRTFFETHVTEAVHEAERRTGGGFNEQLHRALGRRRWVAPRWPVEEGGAGLDALRARIISLELERSGAPAILTTTTLLPPVAIRMFAVDEVKAEVLPGIADGTIRVCLGYTEPGCGSDLAAVRTRAVRDGDEWVINGQKMFTTAAQFCQYCFCLTRTNTDVRKHKGLTVFLLPLDLAGVEIRGINTLGGERTNFVYLNDVHVPDRYRLGEVDQGWTVVSAPLAQEHGMGDEDGSAGSTYAKTTRRLVDAVVAWAGEQSTPDGRPLLEDVRVRQTLARVELGIEIANVSPGPMGRINSADALVRDASELLDLVGSSGLLAHGADAAALNGLLEYGFRFAPGTTIYGGSTDIHRNLVAERTLGLPRSTPSG